MPEERYICLRVSDPREGLPGSFIDACEICDHPIWVGTESARVARRQCVECTSPETMLSAGMTEDTREAVAEATGLTDDEITEYMQAMAKRFAAE